MKFIGSAILALILAGGAMAQPPSGTGRFFKDENKDGKCDVCGREPGQCRPAMRGNRQGRGGCCAREARGGRGCGRWQQAPAEKPAPPAEQK
ncbi:MAG: hypothetical protein KIT09_08075 [Bryobacteraceae bacterium]|nr:hypothetical protein [Bryobacteraceae bacterium]